MTNLSHWPEIARPPRLEPGAVHLWRAALDLGEVRWRKLEDRLAPDEQRRARAMRDPAARRTFVVGRSVLRGVLARYCGCTPEALRFAYGPRGKPELAEPATGPAFNLAHAGPWAVVAVAVEAVGVDVERVQQRPGLDALARRHGSLAERAVLDALEPSDRPAAFYTFWCRKEALLKAAGLGITAGLGRLDAAHAEPQAVIRSDLLRGPFAVADFDPGGGCMGAAALRGEAVRLTAFAFDMHAHLAAPVAGEPA